MVRFNYFWPHSRSVGFVNGQVYIEVSFAIWDRHCEVPKLVKSFLKEFCCASQCYGFFFTSHSTLAIELGLITRYVLSIKQWALYRIQITMLHGNQWWANDRRARVYTVDSNSQDYKYLHACWGDFHHPARSFLALRAGCGRHTRENRIHKEWITECATSQPHI